MRIKVINTISLKKKPEFKNIKKIKKEHCNSLLEFLYNGGLGKWQNPFTKKFLRRESPIIISFLSRCYNMDDDSKININGCNLTYKKHIDKFINKKYLYLHSKKKSTNSNISNVNIQSEHRGGFYSSFPTNNQIHRHSNYPIDTKTPLYFNTGSTWRRPVLAQSLPTYQTHQYPAYIQYPRTSTYTTYQQPPYINTGSTWRRPVLSRSLPTYQTHQYPRTSSTYPAYQLPIFSNNANISTKSQQKGKFYQSLNSGNKYYQREIPDDIWKLIMKLGIYYLGDERGEFIDKMNKKYEKDKEILDKWEREEPDKNSKKIKKYNKKEKRDRDYWSHGFYNFRSNAFEIDDIKAFNKFYGIKTLWDIFNKVDD
jgi:hypothetical protein